MKNSQVLSFLHVFWEQLNLVMAGQEVTDLLSLIS